MPKEYEHTVAGKCLFCDLGAIRPPSAGAAWNAYLISLGCEDVPGYRLAQFRKTAQEFLDICDDLDI
jgi:hypothetical protein